MFGSCFSCFKALEALSPLLLLSRGIRISAGKRRRVDTSRKEGATGTREELGCSRLCTL